MSTILSRANKFLEYCYYILFIVTPLLMASITSELFEFNKMLFIYLLTLFVLFFWLLKIILLNKIIIKKTWLDVPIWLFFLSQVISTIFSIDFHTSIFGYYGRFNGGLLSIGCFIILYYALISNFRDFSEKFVERFLKFSLFGSFLVILWGLPGHFGHDLSCYLFSGQLNNDCWTAQFRPAERLFSTLGQPNWLGAYLAINFFIGLYFYFKARTNKYLILNTIYLILNFVTLLFTRSRSSLLAVTAGILVFLTGYLLFIEKKYKMLLILGIALFIVTVVCKTGISQVDRILDLSIFKKSSVQPIKVNQANTSLPKEASGINSDVTESGDIRKIVWQGAIDLGKRYPLFGTGVETFAYSYYFVRPQLHNLTSEWDYLYNKAHNEYLNYLATTGFLGLGTYLIYIFAVVFIIIKAIFDVKRGESDAKAKNRSQHLSQGGLLADKLFFLSLLASYITILITNFFGFSTTTVNLFFYLIPGLVIVFKELKKANKEKYDINYSFDKTMQKVAATIVFLFLIYGIVYLGKYFLADINYARGDNYYKAGNYQVAGNYINEALKLRYEHVYEDKLSYILANLAFYSAYQKQEDSAKQLKDLADYYNKKSLQASPKNSLYWKTTAKNDYLFYQMAQDPTELEKGIRALEVARSLAPTDPKIPYSMTIFYSLLADEAKDKESKKNFQELALKTAEATVELKPNDRGYYFLHGQLLKKYGYTVQAKKVFEQILQKINPKDEEVLKEFNSL